MNPGAPGLRSGRRACSWYGLPSSATSSSASILSRGFPCPSESPTLPASGQRAEHALCRAGRHLLSPSMVSLSTILGLSVAIYALVRRGRPTWPSSSPSLVVVVSASTSSPGGSIGADNWRYFYLIVPFIAILMAKGSLESGGGEACPALGRVRRGLRLHDGAGSPGLQRQLTLVRQRCPRDGRLAGPCMGALGRWAALLGLPTGP